MLVWITAFIVVSGYVVSCGELQYETRRQLYGRTTLGKGKIVICLSALKYEQKISFTGVPIKALDIACYSVFRDVDFHSRYLYFFLDYGT